MSGERNPLTWVVEPPSPTGTNTATVSFAVTINLAITPLLMWAGIRPRHRSAVGAAIRELLDTRYFLALQLEEATGQIDAEEFAQLSMRYYRDPRPHAEARSMAAALFEVGDIDVDGEELSMVLGCSVADAAKIVDEFVRLPVPRPLSPRPNESDGHPR